MNKLKYLIQYLAIIILFILYKLLGLKFSSILYGFLFLLIGPLFRSNKRSDNLKIAFPKSKIIKKKIIKKWFNYGQ